MWLDSLNCGCESPNQRMGAVDPVSAGLTLLTTLNRGGGASGANGAPGNVISVNNQVSPQISPSFVQQDNPSNSPVTTGATQINANPLPNTPATGFIPGFDAGAGGYTPVGANYLQPSGMVQTSGINWTTAAWAAAGLVLVAVLVKKRKAVAHYSRRAYERTRNAVKAF